MDTCRKMKMEYFLTPYTKENSKWTKDLNIRPETIKLEESISSEPFDIALSNIFMDVPLRARGTKENTNKGSTSN